MIELIYFLIDFQFLNIFQNLYHLLKKSDPHASPGPLVLSLFELGNLSQRIRLRPKNRISANFGKGNGEKGGKRREIEKSKKEEFHKNFYRITHTPHNTQYTQLYCIVIVTHVSYTDIYIKNAAGNLLTLADGGCMKERGGKIQNKKSSIMMSSAED